MFINGIQRFREGNVSPTRRGALLNVAMYDAINEIDAARNDEHLRTYHPDPGDAPADASRPAAAAAAAREVTFDLFPADERFRETADSTAAVHFDRARNLDGDVSAGKEWGRTVGRQLLELRRDDVFGDLEQSEYNPCDTDEPGCFRENWGSSYFAFASPWTMIGRAQFRPDGPPALDSETYAEGWQEVYDVGRDREDRPQEEIEMAAFWRGAAGSPRPPQM